MGDMDGSKDEIKVSLEDIRALVEANEVSKQIVEVDVLTLEDIVWRSPTKLLVEPTEIIKDLAIEADHVARGKAKIPRSEFLSAVSLDQSFETINPDKSDTQNIEALIQARILESLAENGLIDEKGRPLVDEQELRVVVRAQIEAWLEKQNALGQHDPLQETSGISKTT